MVFLAIALLWLSGTGVAWGARASAAFDLDDVARLAEKRAKKPYQAPATVPQAWDDIGYDQWRTLRFDSKHALWKDKGLPFEAQFFHAGFLFDAPVKIHEVAGKARELPFDPKLFDYDEVDISTADARQVGFGGFRIHYPINRSSYKDEVAVFLGASYFRAVSKGESYGLSGRGIAIDTAGNKQEEFPAFREFWLVRPAPQAKTVTIYALLDSPSLAGAYEFVITPGQETTMDVTARLYLRKGVERFGLAPLTSMFFFGESKGDKSVHDFRPEVHDSDGLSLTLGEDDRIWRPLLNPDRLFVNVFHAEKLKEFGLEQRDEAFDHYEDLEGRYEKRPSAWVTPKGDWGPGRVYLIQIPTPNEYNDNIVAFWSPEPDLKPGPATYAYRLTWGSAADRRPPVGRVTGTRFMKLDDEHYRFVVDFEGGSVSSLTADASPKAFVHAPESYGVDDVRVIKNTVTSGWRLVFRLKVPSTLTGTLFPGKKEAVELNARLEKEGRRLTENWSFALEL